MAKLITEHYEDVQMIVEAVEGGPKTHKIRGVFLQCEQKNRNGRVYPLSIMEKEVARYTKELIENRRALGELGHPPTPSINLDRVSHRITELKLDGNNYVGEATIVNTPHGNIVKGLMEADVQLGVSSRGLGSLVEKNGINVVQEDFQLATAADIVADPSAPDAFVQGIMENADWVYNAGQNSWMLANKTKTIVNKMSTKQLSEAQARMFATFLKSLK